MIAAYHAGYVVDASVGVKWFVREREADREAALALRQRHIEGKTQLIVPELFVLEVPNAIKAGRKGTEKELADVLTTLDDLEMQIERHTGHVLRKTNASPGPTNSRGTTPSTSPSPRSWASPA